MILIARLKWGTTGGMIAVHATAIVWGCVSSFSNENFPFYVLFLPSLLQGVWLGFIIFLIVDIVVRLVDLLDAIGRKQ